MKKLMHIIASPRAASSRTIGLANYLIEKLKKEQGDIEIDEFNVFAEEIPELTVTRVKGKYMLLNGEQLNEAAEESWQEIKQLINRLKSADILVVSSPMWNFSLPYKLKQFIDIVVQPGFTFAYVDNGVKGLLELEHTYVVTTHGGDYSDNSPMHSLNQLTPYLEQILGFIGAADQTFISAQPIDAGGPEAGEKALVDAKKQIDALF
ncbi:MAG: FMN-dependent NADH-azoreductase [Candidatus Rifleibacteriota bacterium]